LAVIPRVAWLNYGFIFLLTSTNFGSEAGHFVNSVLKSVMWSVDDNPVKYFEPVKAILSLNGIQTFFSGGYDI
jgi:hypothetical protein